MNRRLSSKFLRRALIFAELMTVALVLTLISTVNPPFQETADDSAMLYQFLEKQTGKQVLGASSQKESEPCPPNKPIIGWIDYAGNKTVRDFLPPETTASACFSSLTEAQNQGYAAE